MIGVLELCSHITMIKRGHYGLLDIHIKLGILKELLAQALETNLLRTKLDENYDQRQAFAAMKREKAIEEGKKRREEKRRLKGESEAKELTGTGSSDTANDSVEPVEVNPAEENGNVLKKLDKTVKSPSENRFDFECYVLLDFFRSYCWMDHDVFFQFVIVSLSLLASLYCVPSKCMTVRRNKQLMLQRRMLRIKRQI